MTTYAIPGAMPEPAAAPGTGHGGAVGAVSAGVMVGGAGSGAGGGSGVPPHRVLGFVRAVDAALTRLGEVPAWSMSKAEQRQALRELDRVGNRLAELEARVLVAAERNEVGADTGAASTAAWLAQQTKQTRGRCAAGVRLAVALDERYDATRRALAQGRVNRDQAQVIVRAVEALTREHDDLPAGTHARAEAHLLDLAESFDAVVLHRLGKRLFEVVCPEAADRVEGEKLAKEEERARRTASLTMRDAGDGTVEGPVPVAEPAGGVAEEGTGGTDLTPPPRGGTAGPDDGKEAPL